MVLFPPLRGRQSTRYRREVSTRRRTVEQEFRALWRDTAEGCGLARVVHVAAGVTVSPPRIGGVRVDQHGRVRRVTVQRHPGQRTREYRDRAAQLADALGAARISIEELAAERWIAITLLDVDPLDASRAWVAHQPDGLVAYTEDGRPFVTRWSRRPHTVVQGQTGSGKSSWTYAQLAALADRSDVRVVGLDPSGLLWRPWPRDLWRVSGLADDLAEPRRVLRELCAEMDRRLALLPEGCDNLDTDADTPLLSVWLEEFPALVRAAELVDKRTAAEVRQLVGRLFSEGRKVGIRLVLIVQRADASIVDGAVRAQAGLRVSFASEADGVRMLHPPHVIDPDEHSIAAPGICAITTPRLGTFRGRSVLLDYRDYCAHVSAHAAGRAPEQRRSSAGSQ